MIDYGLYPAISSYLETYIQHSRRTGRTSEMVRKLGKGDLLVFYTEPERRRVEYLARRELSPEIYDSLSFIVSNDCDFSRIAERRRPAGAVVFDHSWVENHFRTNLKSMDRALHDFGDRFGGNDHSDPDPWARANINFE